MEALQEDFLLRVHDFTKDTNRVTFLENFFNVYLDSI